MSSMEGIDIDFFEYSFLVEACIPPRPIARTMFWLAAAKKYHKHLSKHKRVGTSMGELETLYNKYLGNE